MANSLMILRPYKSNGMWMFDDETAGLNREPFIAGIPEIIELAATQAGIENPDAGFQLMFSATPFPGNQGILILTEPASDGGNWYQLEGTDLKGWLCPALLKYFDKAPEKIYCQISALAMAA